MLGHRPYYVKRVANALVGVGLLAASTVTAAPAFATSPRVALGEVSTRVVRADVDLGEVLRSAMQEQLVTLETPHAERGPVILSAALVGMDSLGGQITCTVSVTLRTARGGTMLAIVEGRARFESLAPVTPFLARRAVEAAARAAVVRVPDALR
jgi:hypothetical protein